MSKKIAFVSLMGGFPWGGSEYLWARTAEQAILKKHEVFMSIYEWSVNHPLIVKLLNQGAHLFPRPCLQKPPSTYFRVIAKLSQTIPFIKKYGSKLPYKPVFDCQPDIICINQGGSYDIAYTPELLNLLTCSSIPYLIICQFNTDYYLLDDSTRTIAQEVFSKAARVIFVAQHNLKLAERQLAQSLPNAVVVQNPVNIHDCSIVSCYKDFKQASFASVARLDTLPKGQDVLFEALSSPTWQERNWQCNLYGSGQDRNYLEALAQHYGIFNRINFQGHVNDVRSIWAENHLLILSSRAEGTPLSLVEAMLCGRPAVVTDVGGNAAWIEESKTGFIAEAPTAKSLGAALERAWQHRENWQQMGVNAHEYASAKFDTSPEQRLLEIILDTIKTR